MKLRQLAMGTGLALAASLVTTFPALSQTQSSQVESTVFNGPLITGAGVAPDFCNVFGL